MFYRCKKWRQLRCFGLYSSYELMLFATCWAAKNQCCLSKINNILCYNLAKLLYITAKKSHLKFPIWSINSFRLLSLETRVSTRIICDNVELLNQFNFQLSIDSVVIRKFVSSSPGWNSSLAKLVKVRMNLKLNILSKQSWFSTIQNIYFPNVFHRPSFY